ncbi:MAG: HD domain-containing protein [Salinivirgaceae bacterium]|nr:HD domain-containing protein [Salinivirgaceae bacterium]
MATKKNTGVNIIMCMALSAGMILSAWSAKAQAARNGTLDVSVAVEEKVLLSPDKESDSEKVEYNLTEHTGTKKITISVSPDDITRLMLSEFCFDVAGQEPIWSTKSSVTFTLTSRKTEVVVRARSEGDLFYQTTIKLTDGRSYGIVDFVVAILIAIAAVCAIYFWSRLKILRTTLSLENEITDRTNELQAQKMKYEELVANYMPKEEFEKLKEKSKDKEKATRYKMVTVLFSDVHGFSNISKTENAEQLIDDLDRFFFHFDEVVKKFHIEKIKSIGDIYMCAGGIPQKNHTNPIEVVLAAFEMYQYMQSMKLQYGNDQGWNLRIGIHTGPVFCNNTGNKKKLEIWGDTVNIASRMEASGQINKVNITGMTYELVKEYFVCQYWGKMPVKYKGEIDMYLIEGFRPHLSEGGLGVKPNQAFQTRLGIVRFDDIEEFVLNMLEEKLPKNLYYHNLKHTIDVTTQVEIIGRHEGISDEEMLLLKTAALFHDTGFTRTYKDHEEAGVEIAREYLPKYDYTPEQIDFICNLIMKTKLPPKPVTLLEQIICDADLDYLGRADFIPVSGNLYRELRERGAIEDDIDKWNLMQIKFIEGHQYFTNSAKQMRDVNKNNQLEAIRRLVEKNN